MLSFDLLINRKNFKAHFQGCFQSGITLLFGPSGSGKTSLLRALAGLDKHQHSEVDYHSKIWQSKQQFDKPEKRKIGFVFQKHQLFPHLSVEKNLYYSFNNSLTSNKAKNLTLKEIIEKFQLTPLLHKNPNQLSGGQTQRVVLAKIIVNKPNLLFLDEPLNAIDLSQKNHIISHLKDIHSKLKIPIVYVTHNLNEALLFANQVVVIDNGKIVFSDDIEQLINCHYLLEHEHPVYSIIQSKINGFTNKKIAVDSKSIFLSSEKLEQHNAELMFKVQIDSLITLSHKTYLKLLISEQKDKQYLLCQINPKKQQNFTTGNETFAYISNYF